MYSTKNVLVLFTFAAGLCLAQPGGSTVGSQDQDGDGLSDNLESDLLQRFAPFFRIAAQDCGGAPVEFAAGSHSPRSTGEFGTIYGQAFPVRFSERSGAFVELHYYHLWNRDCGRHGHPLDVEHVSALLRGDRLSGRAEDWSALYWYAAAHEETPCDAGNGAIAARIGADSRGPAVWVSRGKHASYLSPVLCGKGCGADSCERAVPFAREALINIGEPNAAMNGAYWTQSAAWRFNEKMNSEFTPETIAEIEAGTEPVTSLHSRRSLQSLIAAGNSSVGGLASSGRATTGALSSADGHTGRAVARAETSVRARVRRAAAAVRRAVFPNGN